MLEENNATPVVFVMKEKKPPNRKKRFHKFFWPCILFSLKFTLVLIGFLGYWFGKSPSSVSPTSASISTTVDNHAASNAKEHLPPGQLCPHGWAHFNLTNKCYKYTKQAWTFGGAELACVNQGSHLASIHTKEENDFVSEMSELDGPAPNRTSIWIGGYAPKKDNVFVWTDNSTWDFAWFGKDEPNLPGVENCIELYACVGWMVHCWMNLHCDQWPRAGFVCKKDANGS
ncbi:hypothetical protein QR680_003858 [Steinernema hermaphroditum]|uniref:C-type lectin domain-containing protein n=1 Tax=Steinernema hermaphroditum TaxID=289476 RepID=A0AA39LST2_9BILA|nr:hypothetical protein QR680_003858 [Steinernema hermaphroditum]